MGNFSDNLQSEEEAVFKSNQIPRIIGFGCAQKQAKWGFFSNNLLSEEYLVYISNSDSRFGFAQKHAKWGIFSNSLQSEEYSNSSDCWS